MAHQSSGEQGITLSGFSKYAIHFCFIQFRSVPNPPDLPLCGNRTAEREERGTEPFQDVRQCDCRLQLLLLKIFFRLAFNIILATYCRIVITCLVTEAKYTGV